MKFVYCAECGERFEVLYKASEGKVFHIIRPHKCSGVVKGEVTEKMRENELKPIPSEPDISSMFDSFKFVQKLNDLEPKVAEPEPVPEPLIQESGDKRSKEHLRKELLTSNAPLNLISNIKNLPTSQPVGDIKEEPKGE